LKKLFPIVAFVAVALISMTMAGYAYFATQEAARAGQPRGPEILIEQGVDHVIGIVVLDDGYDEFLHAFCSPTPTPDFRFARV